MDERRSIQRVRILKAGTIAFNHAGGISCTVRNMSETGACLEVASPIGIPDDFTLQIPSDRVQRPCHVAWRGKTLIGVAFR